MNSDFFYFIVANTAIYLSTFGLSFYLSNRMINKFFNHFGIKNNNQLFTKDMKRPNRGS